MKSKRQEELPKKTLSRPIYGWPEFLQQNGSRILLGLTLAVLAVVIIRYRSTAAQQRGITAQASAARARQDLQQLKQAMQLSGAAPELLAAQREQLTAQITAELGEVLSDATDSDAALRADAYAIRGDLYWTLANSPAFPEAATRPALAMKQTPDALLAQAEADYKHILDQYPSQLLDWATAEFGLAAIAENRSDWDQAQKRYEEVETRKDSPDMFKSAAQMRLGLLERIRQPILVGPYPATAPTSEPINAITPSTAASTQATH